MLSGLIALGAMPLVAGSSVLDLPGQAITEARCTALPSDAGTDADAGDDNATAMPLADGTWDGCLGIFDEDWYTFPLRAFEVVNVTVFPWNDVELYVTLETCDGQDRFDAGETIDGSITVVATPRVDGVACLGLRGNGPTLVGASEYGFALTRDHHRCVSFIEHGPWLREGYNAGCIDGFDTYDTWNGNVTGGVRSLLQVYAFGVDCDSMRMDVYDNDGALAHVTGTSDCSFAPVSFTPTASGPLSASVNTYGMGARYYIAYLTGPRPDLAITDVREVRQTLRTDVAEAPNPADDRRLIEVDVANLGDRRVTAAYVNFHVASTECHAVLALLASGCEFDEEQDYAEIDAGLNPGELRTVVFEWDVLREAGDHEIELVVYGWEPEHDLANNVARLDTFVRVGGLGGIT